jgi:hypothetical protein
LGKGELILMPFDMNHLTFRRLLAYDVLCSPSAFPASEVELVIFRELWYCNWVMEFRNEIENSVHSLLLEVITSRPFQWTYLEKVLSKVSLYFQFKFKITFIFIYFNFGKELSSINNRYH